MKLHRLAIPVCWAACAAASLTASNWRLSQLSRKVWQIEDGLPHNYVTAVATDEKGYLLLGTQAGIVRFDGLRFSPFERLDGMWIYAFLRASDGAFWVGSYQAGLHVIRDGKVQSWYAADSIGQGTVYSLLEDRRHRVWLVSSDGLERIVDGWPRLIVRGTNFDGYAWQSMTEDDSGAIWFAAREGLFRVTGGEVKALRLTGTEGSPVTIYYSAYYSTGKCRLYLGTTAGLYQLKCSADRCEGTAIPQVRGPVVGLLATSDGALWTATWGNGIYRNDGPHVEQMSTRDGLADDFVRVLSEDAEHNLWIGTRSGGLTRFRRTALKPIGIQEGLGGNYASAVLGDGAGGLWLGTWRSGLFHWSNGGMTQQPLPQQPLGLLINALALDGAHNLWVGTFHGLWQIAPGRTVDAVPLPGGDARITSILAARDRTLWLAKENYGLLEFASGDPRTSSSTLLLAGQTVTGLLEDTDGRIWIGTKQGLWRAGATARHPLERLGQNGVTALGQGPSGCIWVAEAGNRIQVYTSTGPVTLRCSGLPASAVYIIAADAQGGLWFGTGRGLVRAAAQDVEAFLAGRQSRVDLVAYGASEGMRTIECRIGAQPSSWKLPDGSVWLPTAKGFVEIGPQPTEPLAPPRPWIEKIRVDDRSVAPDAAIRLSPGTHELAVSYTAIRLGRAERVQFQYRMQGLDQEWVEAGSERIARYTHLHPGRFALLVSARDPGGAWSEAVSSAEIEQLPFFYQTFWFRAILAAVAAAMIAILYRIRLHAVRKRYAAVLQERSRIAREWHDTLLAGLSAASWQIDVIAERCRDSALRPVIQSAVGMVRYCRDEARRAIGDLRHEEVAHVNLADSLRQAIRQQTEGTPLLSRVEVEGKIPSCSGALNSDLLRICQEATANALQHAHASELRVRLCCDERRLSLSIEDDGLGMDVSSVDHPPPGHYGLLGMRERAQRCGGKLYLSSQPGRGTVVKAVVPLDS